MKIAVVVPVHNRKNVTLNYLRQMRAITPVQASLDMVVVDDGSTDGTAQAIRESYTDVTLLHGDGNLWWTGAVNMGVQHALSGHYDYVLIMNDDLELDRDFLVHLMRVVMANPDALVSSVVLNRAETGEEEIIVAGFNMVGFYGDIRALHAGRQYGDDLGEVIPCDLLTGASLMIPIGVFRKIGMFDSRNFPHNWGDFEFTRRASRNGYRCLVAAKSKVFTEHNQNYPLLYFFVSTRTEYVKNLFNYDKFIYGFKGVRKTSYMHRPFLIGTLLYMRHMVRLFKSIVLKLVLTKNGLRKYLKRRATKTGAPGFVIRRLHSQE
jgi:GT2 family glycosyltransferase